MKKMIQILFFVITGLCLLGPIKVFSQDNTLNFKDAKGIKQGPWQGYYKDGKLKYTGQFKDNKPVGKFTYYFPSGAVRAIVYHYPDGRSYATFYYETGKPVCTGKYVNQKRDSAWVYYFPEGTIMAEEFYIEGKKHGTWKLYYHSGILLQEKNYVNGKAEGVCINYYDNGKIRDKMIYHNDSLNGLFEHYYPNGILNIYGMYKNDLKEGKWIVNDKNGKKEKEVIFIHGRLANEDDYLIPVNEPKEIEEHELIERLNKQFGIYAE